MESRPSKGEKPKIDISVTPVEGTGFEDGACGGHVTSKLLAKSVGPTH